MPSIIHIPHEIIKYCIDECINIEYEKENNEFWHLINDYQKIPDSLTFTYKGYECIIERNMIHGYHLCGYIFGDLPKDLTLINEYIHGGITKKNPSIPEMIGFDCAHFTDYFISDLEADFENVTYKNLTYLQINCEETIEQIINCLKREKLIDLIDNWKLE
jgi:hypothetical protein